MPKHNPKSCGRTLGAPTQKSPMSRRTELRRWLGQTLTFYATVGECHGPRLGFNRYATNAARLQLVLSNVMESRLQIFLDHVWIAMTDELEALELDPGDHLQFDATIIRYTKNREIAYSLGQVCQCRRVSEIRLTPVVYM
jgi:hypothetical protein